MRPRRRYLVGNAGTEAPSSLLFFDAESHLQIDPARPRVKRLSLRLWSAIALRIERGEVTRREVAQGHTAAEFWALVEQRQDQCRPLWAFAHNLGFDLTQLSFWDRLESREFSLDPAELKVRRDGSPCKKQWRGKLVLNSRPTFLYLQGVRGRVKLIDTGNYWPHALYKIGAAHGLPKGEWPGFDADDDTMFAYCRRDCEVIELAVVELIRRWTREKCGVFQCTAPSLAMTNFKHSCHARSADGAKVNIVLLDNSPARPLERQAYYGPRIEPFYLGVHEGPIHHLDCNSLFPAMMAAHPYPRKLYTRHRSPLPEDLLKVANIYGAVAQVVIDSRTDTYPVRRDGIQLHARGQFVTQLCGPELLRALTAGHVARVHDAWLYSTCDLFSKWVGTWYGRKAKAKAAGPGGAGDLEFAKLVLNSLYGKFAQRGDHWQDDAAVAARPGYTQWAGPHPVSREFMRFRSVAGYAQSRLPGGEPAEAFPAISGFITAYAREYMRGIFAKLPRRSLLYTAMDSMLLTDAGLASVEAMGLIDPDALGKFRVVSTHAEVEIKGPGWYRLDDRWIRTGIYGGVPIRKAGKRYFEMWQSLPSVISTRPTGETLVYEHEERDSQVTRKGLMDAEGWMWPLSLHLDDDYSDPLPKRRDYPRE